MPRVTFSTILKLLLWSLAVGAVLAWFDWSPQDVFGWVTGWFEDVLGNLQYYSGRAISYLLLGAVIVVPLWVLSYLWRALRR